MVIDCHINKSRRHKLPDQMRGLRGKGGEKFRSLRAFREGKRSNNKKREIKTQGGLISSPNFFFNFSCAESEDWQSKLELFVQPPHTSLCPMLWLHDEVIFLSRRLRPDLPSSMPPELFPDRLSSPSFPSQSSSPRLSLSFPPFVFFGKAFNKT